MYDLILPRIAPVVVLLAVGKTILALRFKETVAQQGGYFISGKFDQLAAQYHATSKSYGPFVVAFTEYCKQVLAAGDERVALVKTLLEDAMSEAELRILQDFIPALTQLLGRKRLIRRTSSSRGVTRSLDAESNFISVFCRFVQALCSQSQPPLVLFLDDLQWANPKALGLLKELAVVDSADVGCKIMILCTVREEDEATPNENQASSVQMMKDEGVVITNIEVANMSDVAVNDMISGLLGNSTDDCRLLTDIIYKTTAGNVFFVLQLLRTLHDEELLTLDKSGRWCWDADQILQRVEAKSVLQLLISKIQRLPRSTKEVLTIASCLGVVFEETMVWCASTLTKAEVAKALQLAQEKGLVLLDRDSGQGKFVHDKVQQAVYSLIPTKDQQDFHLNIGRKLSPGLPPDVGDDHLLLVADQVSRGIDLIDDPYEKIDFAKVFLLAGKKAALSSAFSSAAAFLNIGVSLLGERSWTENYALTLSLYNTAAEIEYYNGNLDHVDLLVAVVLRRAQNFEDTLRALFTRIYSLGTRGEMLAACNEGFAVLGQLDERFPHNINIFHRIGAILSFKRLIHGKTDSDILNLHVMEDTTLLTALRMMVVVSSSAFYARKESIMLLSVRLVTRSLQHGINDMSKNLEHAYNPCGAKFHFSLSIMCVKRNRFSGLRNSVHGTR